MPAELQDIKERLRQHILSTYLPGEDASNLQDDTGLKSTGILDSLSTLKLVTFVEETYDITVSPHEAASDFDRIEDIAALVQRKT
jgi:acyl carrier protein